MPVAQSASLVVWTSDGHVGEGVSGVLMEGVEVGVNEEMEVLKCLETSTADSVIRLNIPLQFSVGKDSVLRHVCSTKVSMPALVGASGTRRESMLDTV
jgi:hypothetical protein